MSGNIDPWITRPGWCFSGLTRQISLMPVSNVCGFSPCMSKSSSSFFVRLPRTPSPSTVTLARMSMPAWKVGFWEPSAAMPMSPVRTPSTRSPSVSSSEAAKPG